jgi:hexosaminidase
MAYYKLNRLHLHLSDDQGWRIAINSWPNLAIYGGSTAVGGGEGGYYTQQEYAEIAGYAQSRYITLVPEIDMPGHTNAALASYPELNCDGVAPPLYTGIDVGFSSLCINQDVTYQFVRDVIRELSEITPGRYLHIGGDEALSTSGADYQRFMQRVQEIVEVHNKQMVGWAEIARIDLSPTTIAQYWNTEPTASASIAKALYDHQCRNVILSPGSRAYLDMQYNASSKPGLHWAGYIEVKDAYEWEPASLLDGIDEQDILGVEAPLWSETLLTINDIEFMAFPRLIGIAEIGWSPRSGRHWDEYRVRLGSLARRLALRDVSFYRSPQVSWQS